MSSSEPDLDYLEPITDALLSQLELSGDEADTVRDRGFFIAATAFELATS